MNISKWTYYSGKFFSDYKFWELQFMYNTHWQWFSFNFGISRKLDHAGLRFELEIIGLCLEFSIRDSRHWIYETDSWEN